MAADSREVAPPREQLVYANLMVLGVWIGIFVLLVTYTIYLVGILPSHVPVEEIPRYWDRGVSEYMAATDSPAGWGWIHLLGRGDFLNYLGFAALALTTGVCYLVLGVRLGRSGSRLLATVALLEVVVLGLAASGLLGGGGH
jgi:hypothetical protein